jgi:hypothetical protein
MHIFVKVRQVSSFGSEKSHFYLVLGALLYSLLLTSAAVFAQPTETSLALARSLPIADVHLHTYSASATYYRDAMDRNNVLWAGGVGPLPSDMQSLLGDRFIPAIGHAEFDTLLRQSRSFTDPDQLTFSQLFARADELFKAGKLKGFGELHTDNWDSSPRLEYRRQFRLDNPAMRKIYEIANRYGGFVQIHSGMDATFADDLLALSKDFPEAVTILSHCLPKVRPSEMRSFFQNRSNIYCELSGGGPVHAGNNPNLRGGKFYNAQGPKPGWKELFLEFPDRIMLGSDTCCGFEKRYDEIVQEQREQLLAFLPPDVMKKIAYENALRVLKLPGSPQP